MDAHLEDKRRKGFHLIRDFINKMMFKIVLESSRLFLKGLSDSSRQRNHLQLSRLLLNIVLLGEVVPKRENSMKKRVKTENFEGKVWKTLGNAIEVQPRALVGNKWSLSLEGKVRGRSKALTTKVRNLSLISKAMGAI